MRILCVGGGPAGLYLALLLKKADARHEITVVERNLPYDTFGWGVVFSDQTLGNLESADPESHAEILEAFCHWDDIDVHFKGRTITSGGHGFCGIGRKRLLNILQARCEALGVRLVFETEVTDEAAFGAQDLIVVSDGINSALRTKYAAVFAPQIERRRCRYIWLGTNRLFEAFTFAFEKTEWGWFQAHAYRFDQDTSTFIVETPEEVWEAAGLDRMSGEQGIAFCERLFAPYLDGHKLMTNARHLRGSAWINFQRVTNGTWLNFSGPAPMVLVGDAAHTAHFSVGSGTKLALEDAIALAKAVSAGTDLRIALEGYEAERSLEVLKIQNAARNSTEWFENVDRYTPFEAEQFAYSLLTRSQRISHENLRRARPGLRHRHRVLVRRAECAAGKAGAADVHAVHAARRDAGESGRGLADGAVLLHRRDPRRLLSRSSRQPRPRRRRARLHRNDLRVGGCAHLARLRGHVRTGAQDGVGADRRLRARAHAGEDRAAAGPRGAERLHAARLGRGRRAASRGQLAADRAVRRALRPEQPAASRDDASTTWSA